MKLMLSKFALIACGLIIGYGLCVWVQERPARSSFQTHEHHLGMRGGRFTNPLLECESVNQSMSNTTKSIHSVVTKHVDELKQRDAVQHISYYFRDLNTGAWFGINESEKFAPASLLKVPILVFAMQQVSKSPELFERRITYDPEVFNTSLVQHDQYIQPEHSIQRGQSYTVKELLESMVIESDNDAVIVISQLLGEREFKTFFTDLSINVPDSNGGFDMNIKDYATFYRILYNASFLPRDVSDLALSLLTQTKFTKGIVAGVPSEVTVAHKFGERTNGNEKQFHDCGIVYHPVSPYLMCVMTRGRDFDELISAVASLSKITYDEVQKSHSPKRAN